MSTVLPVYYQIKQAIKGWIVNKQFGLGEKIPSENELSERFKVSRLTVRQAIGQLSQEGFLLTKRGEGTFVTKDERLISSYSSELIGFMDDLFYQVTRTRAKFVQVRHIEAPKPIREKLELGDHAEVVQIKRVRFINRGETGDILCEPPPLGDRDENQRRRLIQEASPPNPGTGSGDPIRRGPADDRGLFCHLGSL